ncbi:ABC transporter ATP-binding protein [uncultured Roseobacter sp.]|uniref:ABC transporter ATP-binding protein n=1 Tax=uncultured Roseobacter sp. TaxID=114847 RepID=UPI002632A7E3|nr:ABC transporter ATP-binding protein [uncultured Roseobacter sp.]
MPQNTILEIDRVTKKYGTFTALHPIDVGVEEGEFIALVGPSGSGKSTLLKCIAGFEDVSDGDLRIAGVSMQGVSPADRPTSMVFQRLALFPHKTIAENIAFPLKLRKVPKAEIKTRVAAMMSLMSLRDEYLTRYPHQLSGGEQQRVALARSMVSDPTLLLLDEPLSALDVKLKKVLQAEIKRLHRELGVTFVHVTHDLEEAMMLADRICVMNAGQLEQIGSPYDIYYRPETKFVAGFISETNLLDVTLSGTGGDVFSVSFDDVALSTKNFPAANALDAIADGPATLMVRPERLRPVRTDTQAPEFTINATVTEFFVKGSTTQFVCDATRTDGAPMRLITEMRGETSLPYDVGDHLTLGFDAADAFIFKEKG